MSVKLRAVSPLSRIATAKLETSGLTEADGATLGAYSVENAATVADSFEALPALVLPYYDIHGKPAKAAPNWPDFYRIRYLEEPKGFGKAAGEKPKRYTQPPNTGVCAYFARGMDWVALSKNLDEPLLLTEGELKAAKACLSGFPCIGLGGVYNFRNSKQGVFFLPELEAFTWARRRVSIVYDSDYQDKPDICRSINVLAEELQERGALVDLVTLENVYDDGRKTGLDDFLMHRSDEELVQLLRQAQPLIMTTKLWAMNDELVYVEDPGLVLSGDQKMRPDAFTGHSRWSTLNVPERVVTPKGTVSVEKAAAAPIWIKWPLRTRARRITYAPGQGRFYEDDYNTWKGWGLEPKKGDTTPWKELIKFIFAGAEPEFVQWFLDWCAYPLQFPGTKMFSAVAVVGRMTGTGKTLIGYTLGRIYGTNFTAINPDDLARDFNEWAVDKQFVLGDEVSSGDKRHENDKFKAMVTREKVRINIKNLPTYEVPDCVNYYFTSNHKDAFFLEDADRRFAIHEVEADEPLPLAFYKGYDRWKNSTEGPAALFYELMQRDLSEFNPKGPAFRTAARNRMVMLGKSDLALWCAELKEDPASKLRIGQMRHQKDLFTAEELLNLYLAENPGGGNKVTKNGMSRALGQAGLKHVFKGMPVLQPDGKQGRYFAVRNIDQWVRVKSGKELVKNIQLEPIRRGN